MEYTLNNKLIRIDSEEAMGEEQALMHCLYFRVTELYKGFLDALEKALWLTALSAARNCVESICYSIYFIDEFKKCLDAPHTEIPSRFNECRIKFTLAQRDKETHKIAKEELPKHDIDPKMTIPKSISEQLKICENLKYLRMFT